MQLKHLIIFAVVGFAVLLGFNVINGNRHENKRAMAVSPDTSIAPEFTTDNANLSATNNDTPSNTVTDQPLAEQPKAMMDKATSQIDDAELADKERLAQLNDTQ